MLITSEESARDWLSGALGVSRETMAKLDRFAEILRRANLQQNLISASTAGDMFWVRHIVDSAQLVPHALDREGEWIDIGSGPGLPGMVVALLEPERRVTLVESRRLRCTFLREACEELGVAHRVTVAESDVNKLPPKFFAVITARAFAPLPRLLDAALPFCGPDSRWLLPKGKNAVKELSTLPASWQKRFHVEPSITDGDAAILIGNGFPQAQGKTRR